jgi:hypothetical protein
MKSKIALIFIIFIFSIARTGLSQSQRTEKCIAFITEISGNAIVKKINRKEFSKIIWGTQLFKGDEIRTTDRSEARLLFSNGRFMILGPNSTVKITGNDSSSTVVTGDVRSIYSASMINLLDMIPPKEDINEVGTLADMKPSALDQEIELTTPENTMVKTNRPSFSWLTKKTYDNCTVTLYDSKGLVWTKKVTENTMKYPESEKGLEFGASYFWNVEGDYLLDADKSVNQKFTVLSFEKSREVQENEDTIRNIFKNNPKSSSLHSILGAYYIKKGLLGDAIDEFQSIVGLNIFSALPHELLSSLYSEVGDKAKAIDELQKAMMLTAEKTK